RPHHPNAADFTPSDHLGPGSAPFDGISSIVYYGYRVIAVTNVPSSPELARRKPGLVDASRPPHHIETTAVLSTETDSLVPVARTAVAHARECFLRCDAVEPGVVRKTI